MSVAVTSTASRNSKYGRYLNLKQRPLSNLDESFPTGRITTKLAQFFNLA